MKILLPALLVSLLYSLPASARNDVGDYWINEVMSSKDAQTALGDDILFFFGNDPHGKVIRDLGEVRTNKKTNAFGKSDQVACHWVFLSAMKELKAAAIKRGGNAVVNIRSNYKNNETSSSETFKCGAGALIAGVALIGVIVEME